LGLHVMSTPNEGGLLHLQAFGVQIAINYREYVFKIATPNQRMC